MRPDRPTCAEASADRTARSALNDLRERLARLSASHPSSQGFDTRGPDRVEADRGEADRGEADGGEADGGEAAAGQANGGDGGETPGQDGNGPIDRLGRLSRLVGGGGRAGSGRPANRGGTEALLPGAGTGDPYRPWFAPGEVCQPWFSPDQTDRSG